MHEGLLWYDSSDKTIMQKIQDAAKRYRQRYDVWPDTCYIHPQELQSLDAKQLRTSNKLCVAVDAVEMLQVLTLPNVSVNNVWIGRRAE